MKTLILYASNLGASAEAATFLSECMGGCDVIDLKDAEVPDFGPYDGVVLGGSIRLGRMQKAVKKLARTHEGELLQKRLGLFILCMNDGEKAQKHFEDAFDRKLRDASVATGLFGGILDFSKMTLVERTILKQVVGVTQSVSLLDKPSIKRFAEKMRGAL